MAMLYDSKQPPALPSMTKRSPYPARPSELSRLVFLEVKTSTCEKERNSIERRDISQWDFDIYLCFFLQKLKQ